MEEIRIKREKIYRWNVNSLDMMMHGFYRATLHLVFGEPGVGKTTVTVYYPIVRIIQERGYPKEREMFLVVDGDGSFEWSRFEQILRTNSIEPEKIVNNMLIWELSDSFDEQHKLITQHIPKIIKERGIKPLLITVDSMTNIYRQIILRTPPQYRMVKIGEYTGKLDLQMLTLRRLALDHDVPVFVTTWSTSSVDMSVSGNNPEKQPFIGGRQMGYYPKIIFGIRMPEARESPLREAYLWKAKHLPLSKAVFRLSDRGIEDP